jgi:exosortase
VVDTSIRRRAVPGPGRHGNNWVKLSLAALLLVGAVGWAYWATISDLLKEWQRNEDYSAGQLVPLVALLFVWVQRKALGRCALKPCWWAGIMLLALAQAARAFGLLFMFESAERYSLVLTIVALVLMVAGRQVFWCARWTLLFLFLMVPFPGQIHNRISGPLQGMATTGSVFLLEVFVPRVSQHGNVVMLDKNTPMAVAEACSGLRMLTAFIIVAAFIAFMVKRSRLQKATIVLSSIPIAVMCNIVRIFLTALLMLLISSEVGEKFFHDFAGLVMMPVAVMLIFAELWLMDKLVVPESDARQGRAKPVGPDVVRARKSS